MTTDGKKSINWNSIQIKMRESRKIGFEGDMKFNFSKFKGVLWASDSFHDKSLLKLMPVRRS